MFKFLSKKELYITEVDGVKFVFNQIATKYNLKKFKFLKESMSAVPQIVKEKMKERNVLIRFTDEEDVVSVTNSKNVLGFYSEDNIEVIFIKSNQSYTQLQSTLYHEIGHFVDRYIGRATDTHFASLTDLSFHSISIKEQHVYSFDYYRNNITEYFAQSFAELLLESKIIKSAPKTKEAMSIFIGALNFC